MEFCDLETARQARGLRLVTLAHVPSAWTEAAKGILQVKGIPFLAVRCGLRDPEIRAWTGAHNAPVAIFDDDPPRSHWSEILALAERLAPGRPLVPADGEARLRLYGLTHEMYSEGGLLWCCRLMMIDVSLSSEGRRGFSLPVAQHLARKYGYAPERVAAARGKVSEVFATLGAQLARSRAAGSPYLLGDGLTALDIYAAAALAPILPLPQEMCPILPEVRTMLSALSDEMRAVLPADLLAHREFIYRQHLELPVQL
jgi:glutathione S-transferase